jgi:hypothetical protein
VRDVHLVVGVALLALNAAAALYGGYAWWQGTEARGFWPLARAGQAIVVVQALLGAVLVLDGRDLPDLHLVYGLSPIAVFFAAEQLRAVSAEIVLERRGLENAQAMHGLSEADQQAVVGEILRREVGVLAAAAAVTCTLAARGAGLY